MFLQDGLMKALLGLYKPKRQNQINKEKYINLDHNSFTDITIYKIKAAAPSPKFKHLLLNS